MQNTASEKTIRLTLRFVTALGFPALEYQARKIARELDIDFDATISEEQGMYSCAVDAATAEALANNPGLSAGAGFASFT